MDSSWCPACDRLILPKRITVPVDPIPIPDTDSDEDPHRPPPPPAPTPVPSSPEVRRKPLDHAPRRRYGGGLVHGTGRVRPGGGLRPRQQQPPSPPPPSPPSQQHPPPPPPPRRTRVIICQETPLYCSEECRQRDLKNSFIESESAGFAGAQAAFNRLTQLELVQETVRRLQSHRRRPRSPGHSDTSTSPSTSPETPSNTDMCLLPIPPPVPPNSLNNDDIPPLPPSALFFTRTPSVSSSSSYISGRPAQPQRRPSARRTPSWGSPTKAPLAPPAKTLFNASSSSVDTDPLSLFEASSLYSTIVTDDTSLQAPTTTGSSDGTASSSKKNDKKTQKRVSFASDAKPPSVLPPSPAPEGRLPRPRPRRRLSSPSHPSSLPPTGTALPPFTTRTKSTSDLIPRATCLGPSLSTAQTATAPLNPYRVAMWPEDEKRVSPCTRVHAELLRGYASKFAPREGRSLIYSRLWEIECQEEQQRAEATAAEEHENQPDGAVDYWQKFEERLAEKRAKKKAEEEVRRQEEERVIGEMLGGMGMREEDQPQARRMGKMAYDGMPGPAEHRGLKYEFNRFLYDLVPPKPQVVERTVKRWDPVNNVFVDEVHREEVYPERKKLFNFEE